MKNLLIGSVVASIALLVWGFVFWALLAEVDTMSPDAELALQSAISEHVPETGTYVIPFMGGDEAEYTLGTKQAPLPCCSSARKARLPCPPRLSCMASCTASCWHS